ncbi:MAG: TonB-dependent receptor, partial [Peristeroidobacter soli]
SDQIETGLAGQIDVRTRRPFDLPGLEVSLNARATTQDQRNDNPLDPNVSFLAANQWDGDDGRFGALINVSYGRTRYRDQSVTAGALVPFVLPGPATSIPPGFTPLQRIFNGSPPIWEAGTDRGLPYAPSSTLDFNTGPGVANYQYLLARDALFASDFQGDRERPAANIALQWAPNDTSEYTFEAFYQGYREQMFNNLHFTFADWWGSLGANPGSTITMYPDTNLIKTRTVGFPFGFNSGDATWQSTNTLVYALNGKWQFGEKFKLESDFSIQTSEFDTQFLAVRTERVPEAITLDFNHNDGIPSWHFISSTGADQDSLMLAPGVWNMGQIFENAGRDLG